MSELIRFGVSIDSNLLKKFDKQIKNDGYGTRSKAISDLIESKLSLDISELDGFVVGVITYIYDHHKREISTKLIDLQHDYHDIIISMQHIHIDHHNCLELVVIRGEVKLVRDLYNRLKALKSINKISINIG